MTDHKHGDGTGHERISRRGVLGRAAGLAAAGAVGLGSAACATNNGPTQPARGPRGRAVTHGRINQSIVQWCFELFGDYWTVEQTCRAANRLGVPSVELVGPEHFPTLRRHGLTCAIGQIDMSPDPPFLRGFNNPAFHDEVIAATREAIDACAEYGYPNVIAFTGYSARDPHDPNSEHISPEEGIENCVEGLKKVIGYAEQNNINICIEMLNSRDGSYQDTPAGELQMKGHPGYQGDDTEYCIEIIERVGSPRMKLLFDIYHVQIMNGDVIRRIRQHAEHIGHVHTAGVPGRHELDDTQELFYPPIMQALLEVGYEGYVAQEFLPTRNPYQGLHEAVTLCDV